MSRLPICPLLLWSALACAESSPVPPCGDAAVFPSYPAVGAPPKVEVWEKAGLGASWVPPDCTGWTNTGFAMLVATAGRFRVPEGEEGLLRRIGAISELQGLRYWSTSHQAWRTLISAAFALEAPTGGKRRKDFSPAELVLGSTFYFEQEDNLTGSAIFRLRVKARSEGHMVFETENLTPMKFLFMTVFPPGEVQSIYFLDREKDDVWRCYAIARTGPRSNSLATGKDASSINRAVAFYRRLAGIPTDQEPPAAR
jgi:hypothetical protein